MKLAPSFLVCALLLGCGPKHEKPVVAPWKGDEGVKKAPVGDGTPGPGKKPTAGSDPSAEILSREPVTNAAKGKHVLVGWAALAPAYPGARGPRASARSQAEAQKLARAVLERLQKGEKIEAIMAEISEDPGSAQSGDSYDVAPGARLVPEFIQMGLRLGIGEAGIVETVYGYHVIQRVE